MNQRHFLFILGGVVFPQQPMGAQTVFIELQRAGKKDFARLPSP